MKRAVSTPEERMALVELVDTAGHATGTLNKLEAHRPPGQLHRAVSVFLLDGSDRLLIQRRAAGKYHSAGLWSNTCCGHPMPGEQPSAAASRRLLIELGLRVAPEELVAAGAVTYEVGDPPSGLVEREYNHLFVGRTANEPLLNASEVAEIRAVTLADLLADPTNWSEFTAWWPTVLRAAMPGLWSLLTE